MRRLFAITLALALLLPLAAEAADKPATRLAGKSETTALERRADALLATLVEAVAARDETAYAARFREDFRDDDGRTRDEEARILANAWRSAPELKFRAERESVRERSRGFELVARTTLVTGEGARPERVRYRVDDDGLIVRAEWLDDAENETEARIEKRFVEKRRKKKIEK